MVLNNYTFGREYCPNGDLSFEALKYFNITINNAEKYINSSISCFVKNDNSEIYLDIEYNDTPLIVLITFLSLITCICSSCCFCVN